jgi:hypothetical protein
MTRDIVNRLRTNRDCLAPCLMDEAADEIVRLERVMLDLITERDDARRQYCRGFTDFCPNPAHDELTLDEAAMEVAKSFGWDCFKQGDGK